MEGSCYAEWTMFGFASVLAYVHIQASRIAHFIAMNLEMHIAVIGTGQVSGSWAIDFIKSLVLVRNVMIIGMWGLLTGCLPSSFFIIMIHVVFILVSLSALLVSW